MISAHELLMLKDRRYRAYAHALETALSTAAEERNYMEAYEVIPYLDWEDWQELEYELGRPMQGGRFNQLLQEMQRLGYQITRTERGYGIQWGPAD